MAKASQSHGTEHCPNFLVDRSLLDQKLAELNTEQSKIAHRAAEEYCKALDTYLELPSLLDPILPNHITNLSGLIHSRLSNLSPSTSTDILVSPSRALYTLIKVRGPKRITTHFPHQVHHLRSLIPILSAVESNRQLHSLWHLRYVLYTWLSVAVRVPFPLDTILSSDSLQQSLTHAKAALQNTGPVSKAATQFLARFLSRRDTHKVRDVLVAHTLSIHLVPTAPSSTRAAGLTLLASLFKHAHRNDLQPYVHSVLKAIPAPNTVSTTTEAHLITKLSHRVALSFLPPRPAAWRYIRALPAIRRNAGHTGPVEPEVQTEIPTTDSEALETVLDLLLTGLAQRDTVVRWSAAKGLARITARLPQELALDVIDAVLAVFKDVQQFRVDAAWHGACLAIAELARRGLLLPRNQHFRNAFDAVQRAASFDLRRGSISVGAHVRDAACYAVWAVARAYAKEDVASFAPMIANAMVPLALLDREINCRRAAAAALQECVGRLSPELFIKGIELITLAEYFSLGDRNASYLTIAPQVALIGEGTYFDAIIKELWIQKLVHWDPTIRALAAKALARLVGVDKNDTITQHILPELLSIASRKGDVIHRHGAILGIAEVAKVVGYRGIQTLGIEIRSIPEVLNKDNAFVGRTGDDMRIASCHLIQSLAIGATEVYLQVRGGRSAAEEGLKFIETILACGKEHMYAPATSAYAAVCDHIIANDHEWHVKITQRVLHGISESSLFEYQRGFALAAGACGDSEVSHQLLTVLCKESEINKDVEVRRNCVKALGVFPVRVVNHRINDVLQGLARAIEDYDTDDRGDVGSWVREAGMQSASKVMRSMWDKDARGTAGVLDVNIERAVLLILNRIVEQCCSKIDRTRSVAGQALEDICIIFAAPRVHRSKISTVCQTLCSVFGFPHSLEQCIQAGSRTPVNFSQNAEAFRAMRRVFCVPELAKSVIRGFVSASGATGQQRSGAGDALISHLREQKHLSVTESELREVVSIIDNRADRLQLPALYTLDILLKSGVLCNLGDADLKALILTVRNSWRNRLRNFTLVNVAVSILSEIASLTGTACTFQFHACSTGRECLEAMAILLGGPLPRLRRISAENMYMVLLEVQVGDSEEPTMCLYGKDDGLAKAHAAMNILLDASWEKMKMLEARQKRNELCSTLGIRTPTTQKPKSRPTTIP